MKKIIYAIMIACGIFIFSGLSYAESYVSAYIGSATRHDSDVSDNTGAGLSGEFSFEPGMAAGAKLGYWFSEEKMPYLGLQFDLNKHFPSGDKLTVSGVGFEVDTDVTVYSLTINAIVRYLNEPIRPYYGVGGGWFRAKIDNGTILGIPFQGEEDTAFGWQLLAGVDYIINPNLSVFGEYKYSGADFEFAGDVGLDVEYRVSQIYAGISYHF